MSLHEKLSAAHASTHSAIGRVHEAGDQLALAIRLEMELEEQRPLVKAAAIR